MNPAAKPDLDQLKEALLTMANYAEVAVGLAVKAVLERDDRLAERVKAEDRILDDYEVQLDEMAISLLAQQRPALPAVRVITMTMKISQNLERVGDEATTIARRALELNRDAPLKWAGDIRKLAALALEMLKEALDAFVRGNLEQARAVVARDREADAIHKRLRQTLLGLMTENLAAVERAQHLLVIAKSLERIADHATNIAEEAVYLYEGRDIRHTGKGEPPATTPPA
jgi:phosphate transport system protein